MAEDLLGGDESLFASTGVLDAEYLPKLMPYREQQQKYIAECISRLPAIGTSLFIHGPPGIGKTACVRWVLRELNEAGDGSIVPVYVNCWRDSDASRIGASLCGRFGINTSYRGRDELFPLALQKLRSFGSVALALDEIDRVQDAMFIYQLLEEIPHKCIFLISTSREWLARLDNRIRSRLVPEQMEFRPYDREQTKGILEERMRYAFVPGAWEKDAFETVVRICSEFRDIRTGLSLMRSSALEAEKDASRKVTPAHVSRAAGKMDVDIPEEPKARNLADFGK